MSLSAEGPAIAGKALAGRVALLCAPDLIQRSGSIQWAEDLADAFDVADEAGRRPPGYWLRRK
jgi:hypothetical protein